MIECIKELNDKINNSIKSQVKIEMEKVLEKIECDLELYYNEKLNHYIKKGPNEHQDFYIGGLAALSDVKEYLKKEINKLWKK